VARPNPHSAIAESLGAAERPEGAASASFNTSVTGVLAARDAGNRLCVNRRQPEFCEDAGLTGARLFLIRFDPRDSIPARSTWSPLAGLEPTVREHGARCAQPSGYLRQPSDGPRTPRPGQRREAEAVRAEGRPPGLPCLEPEALPARRAAEVLICAPAPGPQASGAGPAGERHRSHQRRRPTPSRPPTGPRSCPRSFLRGGSAAGSVGRAAHTSQVTAGPDNRRSPRKVSFVSHGLRTPGNRCSPGVGSSGPPID
jgi:hypothetical protein